MPAPPEDLLTPVSEGLAATRAGLARKLTYVPRTPETHDERADRLWRGMDLARARLSFLHTILDTGDCSAWHPLQWTPTSGA